MSVDMKAERDAAFRKARRHSWLVRILKATLPMGVAVLVVGYGLILNARKIVPVRKGDKFDIGVLTLDRGTPSMKNPKYEGYNNDGSRFFVTAKQATPDLSQPDRVSMKTISGTLTQADNVKTFVTASSGLYDNKKSQLDLNEQIDIVSESGLKAKLNSARIEIKASKVVTDQPVAAQMPIGSIRANAMTLLIKKRQAVFSNGVAVKLKPKKKQPRPAAVTAIRGTSAPGNPGPVQNVAIKPPSASLTGQSSAPIDVVAMTLHIDDVAHTAVFTDAVRASQAGSTMTAKRLDIEYESRSKNNKSAGKPAPLKLDATPEGSKLKRIMANGKVVMTSANGRRAKSDSAEFDARKNTATLIGNVVLTQGLNVVTGDNLLLNRTAETALLTGKVSLRQGKNVLQGGRLFVNRKTATSELTSPGRSGRIFATFYQNSTKGRSGKRRTARAKKGFSATQFKTNPNAPIKIIANRLDINDKVKSAIFRGKVVAKQAGMTIHAATLIATYSGRNGLGLGSTALNDNTQKPAGKHPPTQLKRVEARKNVKVTSSDGQTATGDWADYDVRQNRIILGGNVKLRQGSTELLGERLVINMVTGKMKIIPRKGGSGGRKMSLGGGPKCTRACLQIIPGEAMEQFRKNRGKKGASSWNTSTLPTKRDLKALKSTGNSAWKAYRKQ